MSFSFQSLGHFFAYAAQEIVRGAKAIESVLVRIQAHEQVIEQITGLINPQAVLIERAAFAMLGKVMHAVHDAGEAAMADGLNIVLDAQTIADVRALIPAVKSQLGTLPTPTGGPK